MSMDGKDLNELINEQMKDVEVPDSLKPENIEKLLDEKRKKRRKNYYLKIAAAAACGVLLIGITAAGAAGLFGNADSGESERNADYAAVADMPEGESTESTDESPELDSDLQASGKAANRIKAAADYDEIYRYIEDEYQRRNQEYDTGYATEVMEDAETQSTGSVAENGLSRAAQTEEYSGSGAGDYSDTNTREEDVGEADIVKTDGKRLYILNNRRIQIVGIGKDEMEPLGVINMGEADYVSEIYIKDDRLIVVYTRSEYVQQDDAVSDRYGGIYKEYTVAETFDVSQPEKPESLGSVSQSGNYYTMRVAGDYVYLFSMFYADVYSTAKNRGGYIPEVQGELLGCGDILMPQLSRGDQYIVISTFAIENPNEKVDSKAVFGTSGLCYVSNRNIYICESYYDPENSDVTQTCIRKVAYKNGKLEGIGQAKVDGTLNDSFSIDEYQGNLRLAVTVSPTYSDTAPVSLFRSTEEETVEKDSNSLYILDENLNELSRIDGLAEDESIYSARFMEDTGYFVTYRQIDPLFSVDLSDPENPKIIGTLKIPGFSDYLHPYGEGLLLGIGMDVDESGVTTNGVKLSMFDISDPSEVEEIQKYVLEDIYSTEVSYNYKAALINQEKNLIGFPAYGDVQHYFIFSYGKDGFTCVFDREMTGYYSDVRALYVEDKLYLVAGNTVEAFRLDTFDKVDDIVL